MRAIPLTASILIVLPAWGAGPDNGLQDLLSRMHQASTSFQSMSAKVKYVTHTSVLNDNSEEAGTVLMKKVHAGLMQGLTDFTVPDRRTVAIDQRKIQVFYPKIKTVQIF